MSENRNECENVSVRHFAKKSSLVLTCLPSVVSLSVRSYSAGNSHGACTSLVLDPGNEHSNPDTRGHCTGGPSSLVGCLRVSSSKCLRKKYNNREIQNNLFSFLSFQSPILRKVLPMPSEMPFLCLMFLN